MVNVELRHLRYFVAVAEEANFSKAARRLRLAQPSLSHQIQALEADLKATLFVRSNRGAVLTATGRILLARATHLLQYAAETESLAREMAQGKIGALGIGYIAAVARPLHEVWLPAFRRAHPKVEVAVRDLSSLRQVKALGEGSIDVGFLRPPLDAGSFTAVLAAEEVFLCAVPSRHPFARLRAVPWSVAAGKPMITSRRDENPGFWQAFQREAGRHGFVPVPRQETSELANLLQLVAAGEGWAPVSSAGVALAPKGVVFRPFTPAGARLETFLAWRKESASALTASLSRIVTRGTPALLSLL